MEGIRWRWEGGNKEFLNTIDRGEKVLEHVVQFLYRLRALDDQKHVF